MRQLWKHVRRRSTREYLQNARVLAEAPDAAHPVPQSPRSTGRGLFRAASSVRRAPHRNAEGDGGKRGQDLGLNDDEIAFYDALEVNDSAVAVLGEPTLKTIARELVTAVRNNTSIDWTIKESVRAKIRVMVKRILRKYGYPPDKQEKATQTVLEQAELFSEEWADEQRVA